MTCGFCRRAQEDGFKEIDCKGIDAVDECPAGEVPKLSPSNLRAWFLISRILPGLFDGYGAANYEAIEAVFRIYQTPPGQRAVLLDKCIIVISAIQEAREAERPKSGHE